MEEKKITREEFKQAIPETVTDFIKDADNAMVGAIASLTAITYAKKLENWLFGEERED